MSRQIYSVNLAWTEYFTGIFPSPSILEVEAVCGNAWRKENTETQFYGRRMPLIRAIKKLALAINQNIYTIQRYDLVVKNNG